MVKGAEATLIGCTFPTNTAVDQGGGLFGERCFGSLQAVASRQTLETTEPGSF